MISCVEKIPFSKGNVQSNDMTASLCSLQSSLPPSDGDPLLSKLASSTKMAAGERLRDEQPPPTSLFSTVDSMTSSQVHGCSQQGLQTSVSIFIIWIRITNTMCNIILAYTHSHTQCGLKQIFFLHPSTGLHFWISLCGILTEIEVKPRNIKIPLSQKRYRQ